MKIKILTLNGYFNYGNRLQLFALSKVLERFGGDVSVYWPKSIRAKVKEYLRYYTPYRLKVKKEIKIRKFTKKHIPKISNHHDSSYLVIGSDQVWNPGYYRSRRYLLDTPDSKKTISYAASIGWDKLNEGELKDFRRGLVRFDAISVREKTAKKLLKEATDKKIVVVLDPTLLLDASDYERLEKKPKDVAEDEKYVLCYILGNREHLHAIGDYAKKNNYRMILFSDKKESDYGIEEFLYLIHHAKLVCTDSFHACVFSFIFERPFLAFRRSGEADYMYSRLQNFIETFHLEGREYDGSRINGANVLADYTNGKEILKKEQKRSLEYLIDALGMNNESK